jgi:hypothetical protein
MKLFEKIEKVKHQMADYLNGMNERFSLQTKKRIFITLGILMGCICFAMIIQPFRNPTANQVVLQNANGPVVIVPPAQEEPLISPVEFSMLEDFKQMMDSLNIYDPKSYKEILNGREGLMDSIKFLIKLYQ